MGVVGKRHASAALPSERTPGTPLYRRQDVTQRQSGRVRKISPTPGFEPRVFHAIAIHFTDEYVLIGKSGCCHCTWAVQVLRYPNFFFSGMEADRNLKVVGEDVAVL